MMSGRIIDWQAEDGDLLPPPQQENQQRLPKRRRLLIFLLLFLVLLIPAGIWGFRRIEAHNADLARQAIEDRYLLMREAAILGDEALFAERIGPGDRARMQQGLVADHSWLNREPLGLSWQKLSTPVISITFSANGREAVLIAQELYTHIDPDGQEQSVQLAHEIGFKWEAGQWVYTRPVGSYWDGWVAAIRPAVRLSYPKRDSAIAERLADELQVAVARICVELEDMQCPPDYQVDILFGAAPAALLNPAVAVTPSGQLYLPTPTVAGRPVDETAYAAFRDGYVRLVTRGAIADLSGWECCDGQVFFDVLLDYQMRELGFPAGLPANPNLAHLVRKKVQPDDLFGLWGLSPDRIQPETLDRAQAVIGFFTILEPDISHAEWQRRLAIANNYHEWAGEAANVNMSPRLRAAWINYLYSQSGVAESQVTDRPEQDVLLLCSGAANSPGEVQLFRYESESNALQPELPGRTFRAARLFTTLDHGVLLAEGLLGNHLQLYSVENGAAQLIWENHSVDGRTWFETSPLGNYLFFSHYSPDEGETEAALLDVPACQRGECVPRLLPEESAPPVWSPDEQHLLYVQDETLYLETILDENRDENREVVLDPPDEGYYDFSWLDNNTFAYSRIRETARNEIIHWADPHMVTLDDGQTAGQTVPLFNPDGLQALLPDGNEVPDSAQIKPHPVDPQQFFVIYEFWEQRTFYVLALDRGSGEARMLFTAGEADSSFLTLSPDGRWFTYSREGEIMLYDTVSGRSTEIGDLRGVIRPEWSADSQWLFALSENVLLQVAPGTGASHLYVDPNMTCSEAIWSPE